MLLSTALLRDLERRVARGHSSRTVLAIRNDIRAFLSWLERTAQVTETGQLQSAHITQWLLWLRSRPTKKGLPLKLVSIFSYIDRIKTFCQQLVREGLVSNQVLDAFGRIVRPLLLPKPTPAHDRIRTLLRSMPVDTPVRRMLRTIAEVLYTSGIRPCELLAMNVDDLNLEYSMAKVIGKGRRERMVPLGATAVRLLETYLQGVRPLFLLSPTEPALWLSTNGRRYAYSSLYSSLKRLLPSNFGVQLTCYTFRRACATEMIRSGASVWAVKELLGHEDLEKLKHYVQLTIHDLKKTHARCHPRDRLNEEGERK